MNSVGRQARLEPSGGATPDLWSPPPPPLKGSPTGSATPRVLRRHLPPPPPSSWGPPAKQLVAKGVALRRPWALEAPNAR